MRLKRCLSKSRAGVSKFIVLIVECESFLGGGKGFVDSRKEKIFISFY